MLLEFRRRLHFVIFKFFSVFHWHALFLNFECYMSCPSDQDFEMDGHELIMQD